MRLLAASRGVTLTFHIWNSEFILSPATCCQAIARADGQWCPQSAAWRDQRICHHQWEAMWHECVAPRPGEPTVDLGQVRAWNRRGTTVHGFPGYTASEVSTTPTLTADVQVRAILSLLAQV